MAEYSHRKLRGRIIEKFGTLTAFFDNLHISSVQASKKLNGKAGFSKDDIDEWCGLLDINLEDVGPFFYAQ